jgi:hypothetical protein
MNEEPINLPPIVRECVDLRALVEWAETLLCNARPMEHCSQIEWDATIARWRDQKHAVRIKTTQEIISDQ